MSVKIDQIHIKMYQNEGKIVQNQDENEISKLLKWDPL